MADAEDAEEAAVDAAADSIEVATDVAVAAAEDNTDVAVVAPDNMDVGLAAATELSHSDEFAVSQTSDR